MKTKEKTKNKAKNKIKKRKEKIKYIKYCIAVIILVLIGVGIYFFLTAEDENTNLTILEKRWILQNKDTLVDINVPNNLAVVADNGKGIIFDFLEKIEKDTELSFNKKSYNYKTDNSKLSGLSIMVLGNDDKMSDKDILILEDTYLLVSKNNNYVSDVNELYGEKIGVLKENKDLIANSMNKKLSYYSYNSLSSLISDLKNNKISYAILPRYYSLKDIVKNNLYVNQNLSNLSNKIVLRTSNNERLSSIISKYLETFKANDYMTSYENNFMSFYIDTSGTTDIEISTLSREIYTYGYVKNSNYSIKKDKRLYGQAGENINLLKDMANMEIEYKEYKNKESMQKAIDNNEVDIAFIDFDYDNENCTVNAFNPQMIALSKTNYLINSKEGLQNRKLYAVKDTYLKSYLEKNYSSMLNEVKSPTSKIEDDAILVIDEIDYYLNREALKEYYTLLKDDYDASYKFYVKENHKELKDFLDFTLMYSDIETSSINNLMNLQNGTNGFKDLYLVIVLIIVVPVIILFTLVALTKNRKNLKLLHKEDVLKYNDMLTSLKNRNYLRAHIDEWDEVKISPRAVIIADLNNLKYVNDNYGQEEGNMLIKKAAAILINTQLEKSEIIRTDGNEFLIYLIGYNKTQVNTYINKLSKEFEKLPHGFGAAIGYSMILDEIKTIDDAINEASIAMRQDKEQNYK